MGNQRNRESGECQRLLDALEDLPLGGELRLSVEVWRAELPEAEAAHADSCEACRTALEEFVETRKALARMKLPEAGPWFTGRVMAAIAAKEREAEAQDWVWISVRRLAPRLVALSALLLVLGGGWALELRKGEVPSGERRGGDMVFDSWVAPVPYDDGLGTTSEVR